MSTPPAKRSREGADLTALVEAVFEHLVGWELDAEGLVDFPPEVFVALDPGGVAGFGKTVGMMSNLEHGCDSAMLFSLYHFQTRRAHCLDDSSRLNNTAVAMSVVPATWPATQQTPDYYGVGYRFASTLPDATDGAEYRFRLDSGGTPPLDARWTSGTNRSPRAAYAVVAATGDTLAVVAVDQTTEGGRWHALGTWTFPAGWNRMVLLRRDTTGTVVVADAVGARQ